ncbi:hypothetical protein [Mycolicibacterium palauense]|uniref:hypothetical protein n=1 Tax=Mycolicibacterium palauense TaxID=2034511 RepID=UPI000BFF03E1|nr:hypothetical protein [Mycolicibacterium palauense]
MTTFMTRVREVKKAVAAFSVSFAGMEGLGAAIDASSDMPWIHAIAVGVSAVVGAATWFVRNEATVDQVLNAIDNNPEIATEAAVAAARNPDVVERLIASYKD